MYKSFVRICLTILCIISACIYNVALAAPPHQTIIFIPQDNRPISFGQTAANIRALGYDVLTPPEEYLGNRENPYGQPEKIATWLIANAPKAYSAVISNDTLIYGSLVASRIHNFSAHTLHERAKIYQLLKEANPSLNIYIFSSIMRTPQSAQNGGEDAKSYLQYASDIAKYTALLDKKYQLGYLRRKDSRQLKELKHKIPHEALDSWLARRKLNFDINKELIDLLHDNTINYLALGCDDNAPYSQTNLEARQLDKYAGKLYNYQSVSGIDEVAYILLTRIVNHIHGDIPFVVPQYSIGVGSDTIPAYANDKIGTTVATQIKMAGGLPITNEENADLIIFINTLENGATGSANNPNNTTTPTVAVVNLVDRLALSLEKNKTVAIGDIAFANGADNALMQELYNRKLLDKIKGYAGWNTPTNSSGYAIAMGMAANYTTYPEVLRMLEVRYLDDWLYQANIRQIVANQLGSLPGSGDYSNTGTRTIPAEKLATQYLQQFIEKYQLEKFTNQANVAKASIIFPWHRMFEAQIIIPNN